MSTAINNPLALYAGYMGELVSLYGKPLAPYPLGGMSAGEVRAKIDDIDASSIRCVPITPLQRLSVEGAMPRRCGSGWDMSMRDISVLIKGYMNRSAPFMPDREPPSAVQEILLSDENDFISAIETIHDLGDAFIGVGTLLPFIYAAWQNASHAYVANPHLDVARIFVPLYGALLCIGRNRIEFLSALSGRPIPEGDEWFPKGEVTPAELCMAVSALPKDHSFESVISTTIGISIASRSPKGWAERARELVDNWFTQLRWTFNKGAPEIDSQENPLWPLIQSDSKGRGGPLVSEESYQRHRRLFLQGRVTGVGSGVDDFGISTVSDDMADEGLRPRVVYLSNVEDVLFQDLALNVKPASNQLDVSARLTVLYSDLFSLDPEGGALLISAKHLYPTTVDDVHEYTRAAYATNTPFPKRDEAYKSMYFFRLAAARAKRFIKVQQKSSLYARLDSLINDADMDQRMQNILIQTKSIFHGSPIDFSYLKRSLMKESHEFRELLSDSEKEIFLHNMVLLGIVRIAGEGEVEVILPSGRVLK